MTNSIIFGLGVASIVGGGLCGLLLMKVHFNSKEDLDFKVNTMDEYFLHKKSTRFMLLSSLALSLMSILLTAGLAYTLKQMSPIYGPGIAGLVFLSFFGLFLLFLFVSTRDKNNEVKENKKRNKTKQNKTKQNKTKQNKNKRKQRKENK